MKIKVEALKITIIDTNEEIEIYSPNAFIAIQNLSNEALIAIIQNEYLHKSNWVDHARIIRMASSTLLLRLVEKFQTHLKDQLYD